MKKILLTALMLFCIAQTTIAQNYALPKDSVAFSKVEHDFDKDGTKDLCVLVGKEGEDIDLQLLLFLSSDYEKSANLQGGFEKLKHPQDARRNVGSTP